MVRENFEILTGHAPKSDLISAKIIETFKPEFGSKTTLEIHDLWDSYSYPIEFAKDPVGAINCTLIDDSAPIFKRLFQEKPMLGFLYERVQGMVNYGSLITSKGKRLMIILERNLPIPDPVGKSIDNAKNPDFRADFRMKMIAKDQLRPLFEANWLGLTSSSHIELPPKKK